MFSRPFARCHHASKITPKDMAADAKTAPCRITFFETTLCFLSGIREHQSLMFSINDFAPARHWRGYDSAIGNPKLAHRSKLSAARIFCHRNTKHQSSSHCKRKKPARSPVMTSNAPKMIIAIFMYALIKSRKQNL